MIEAAWMAVQLIGVLLVAVGVVSAVLWWVSKRR